MSLLINPVFEEALVYIEQTESQQKHQANDVFSEKNACLVLGASQKKARFEI